MASKTASSADEKRESAVVPVSDAGAAGTDKRGKHQILAELKHLDQDAKFLQEELEELEKTENVSTICTDLPKNMETKPDIPLLPEIDGLKGLRIHNHVDVKYFDLKHSVSCRALQIGCRMLIKLILELQKVFDDIL